MHLSSRSNPGELGMPTGRQARTADIVVRGHEDRARVDAQRELHPSRDAGDGGQARSWWPLRR